MKSFLSLQKFQEDDTQVWEINCTERKEQLFSRKILSGARNRLSPVSIEWGGLRRIRAHRVNENVDTIVENNLDSSSLKNDLTLQKELQMQIQQDMKTYNINTKKEKD
ncbi:hypothetical protein AVEN_73280-1 [Araneus ventricosus]|uniref:Uncharacterized protein n=1 Tax=Araneus ventricosus TaxID=182803 RepID=A0A4Y2VH04_ARAVE|nr:hypothetical protein AVEN_73280-1 [Araneus ventricosus]